MSHQSINLFKRRLANFSIQQKINAVAHQKKLEFQITAERSIDSPLLLEQEKMTTKQIKLGFIGGLVSREKSVTFEKILSCYWGKRFSQTVKQAVVEHSVLDLLSGQKVSGRLAELKTPCRIASPEHSIADNWISL
ncbi:hypothetical protein VIGAN_02031600 [Vigna angularis var. angularis]|uniref:Uncharacterized protein n=1 Tax=Vigna angularis var. angularis TaxID=157739 RepID=A0A0S3RB23_PHAAN|nr:hypothetical protein VIGAN_02031600 [Vigna angularis var. angularis]